MKLSFPCCAALCALPRPAGGLIVALGLLAGPAQAVLVTTYNTGTTAPVPVSTLAVPGFIDTHYTRVVSPLTTGAGVPLGDAMVSNPPLSNWLGPNGTSSWLNPAFNFDGTVPPTFSTQYYETTFDLTNLNLATAVFSGRWATDNALARIYLNGVDLNSAGGAYGISVPNAWQLFSFSGSGAGSTLVAGMNYLTFQVSNAPSPINNMNGLRVEYTGDALPVPEPASYALMALGLAGIGIARRRRAADR